MRTSILSLIIAAGATVAAGCKDEASQAPKRPLESPDDSAGTKGQPTRETLLSEWAKGPFTKVHMSDLPSALVRHLRVNDEAGVSTEALDALRATLMAFIGTYASTEFEKYLAFRVPDTLAGADHPRVRQRIEVLAQNWNPDWGDPPSDGVGVMRCAWRMYILGELAGASGGPVIERVNWDTCRVNISRIGADEMVLSEWDQTVGTESHFHRTLMVSRIGSAVSGELETGVPNRVSAEEIAKRDGELYYADFDIVLKTADIPPHPIILRLIYDRRERRWLPLNAFKVINEPPRVFIW